MLMIFSVDIHFYEVLEKWNNMPIHIVTSSSLNDFKTNFSNIYVNSLLMIT